MTLLQNPSDNLGKKRVIKTVKYLFKMGASPNYIPRRDWYLKEKFSTKEKELFHFMPLEIAALTNNKDLVEVNANFRSNFTQFCLQFHCP